MPLLMPLRTLMLNLEFAGLSAQVVESLVKIRPK